MTSPTLTTTASYTEPNALEAFNFTIQQNELKLELDWYDYGARFYDAALGRFQTIGPLTDDYSFQSPFVYAGNNPIRYIDLFGLGPWDRIIFAQTKVVADKRTYKQVIGAAAYGDKYVDCSEYGREISLSDGYDPGRSTWHQMKYYKGKGEWATDISNVRAGDFLFWKAMDEDGNEFYHTGIATELDEDGKFAIAQSTKNGGGKSIHEKYKTNVSGTLWEGSKYEMEFVGAGRPKGDTYAAKETISEVEVTANGETSTRKLSSKGFNLIEYGKQLLEESNKLKK